MDRGIGGVAFVFREGLQEIATTFTDAFNSWIFGGMGCHSGPGLAAT